MYHGAEYSSISRYSGKVLLATIMLVFVFVAFAILMGYGVPAVSKCTDIDAKLAALNTPKVLKGEPKIGLVKGIAYNPPNSCAVVDTTMVHVGDMIHDIAVTGIQNNTVEFSKDGVTWKQAVLEAPHAAWTNPAKDDSLPAK